MLLSPSSSLFCRLLFSPPATRLGFANMLGFFAALLMGVGDFSPDGERDRPNSFWVRTFNPLLESFLETEGIRLSLS